jgi:hypothetical protein
MQRSRKAYESISNEFYPDLIDYSACAKSALWDEK